MKIILVGLFYSLLMSAQTPVNPVTAKYQLYLPILADASYQVNCMNINFTEQSYLNTSQDANNVEQQLSNCLTGYGILDKSYKWLANGAFEFSINKSSGYYAIASSFIKIIANFASENTQYRYYAFYLPVSAPYAITASLPGDFIFNPNNKVELYSGDFIWKWSGQLSSDKDRTFYFDSLPAGPYICIVGLGSTSSYTHSAGHLTQVQIQSPTLVSWNSKSIIALTQTDTSSILPFVGNSTSITIPFLPVPANTNIISGGVGYANYSTGTLSGQYSFNTSWCWKGSPGRWILYPQVYVNNGYVLNGSGIFQITRSDNYFEYYDCNL